MVSGFTLLLVHNLQSLRYLNIAMAILSHSVFSPEINLCVHLWLNQQIFLPGAAHHGTESYAVAYYEKEQSYSDIL